MPDLLEEAKRLSEAASRGPWDARIVPGEVPAVRLGNRRPNSTSWGIIGSKADAEFIARARTLIPELVERAEQAEKNARRVEYAWENLRGWMPNGRGVPNWTREMNDAVEALSPTQSAERSPE